MFANREKKREEINSISEKQIENCEIPDVYKSDQLDNIAKQLGDDQIRISPIVFTSIGNNRNYGLVDLPLQISQAINFKIGGDVERLEGLSKDQLNYMDRETINISIDEAVNYILQNSFMSFCSLIDGCDLNQTSNILTYLPIKQMVYDEIMIGNYNIRSYISNLIDTFSMYNELKYSGSSEEVQNQALNNAISFALCTRDLILQYIVNKICFGTDQAVNDILMQVHTVPNINEIYLEISKQFPSIREFKSSAPECFSSVCTISIKNYLRQQIITLIGRNLIPCIESLVSRLFYVQANIYGDYYYSIKEIKNVVSYKPDYKNKKYDIATEPTSFKFTD